MHAVTATRTPVQRAASCVLCFWVSRGTNNPTRKGCYRAELFGFYAGDTRRLHAGNNGRWDQTDVGIRLEAKASGGREKEPMRQVSHYFLFVETPGMLIRVSPR